VLKPARLRIAAVCRSLGSLLPGGSRQRRDARRVIRPWREDSFRSYPSVGLTPARALAFLQQADQGAPRLQFELFSEMLRKWPRLAAVESTRRLALTGLDWEITPPVEPDGRPPRDGARVADYCRSILARLDHFRDVLDHLASAIGHGLALAELVWEQGELIDLVPVPYTRLISDPHEPWRLRVLTEDDPHLGVPLDEHPCKWILHKPRATPGRDFDCGLLRASVLLYVAQNLSFKDWLIYSQIAGMPVRVGRFEPGTSEGDKQKLLKMLESLGTDAVAILSKNIELQMFEARSGDKPYEALQDHCNTEVTILWLGQHLTTDIREQGSRAAAEIHDRVREDLLVGDIADEAQTIRRDVLTPLVRARFGGGVTVPRFRRSLIQSVDTKVLADTLATARKLGLRIPQRWAHRALGIPEPSGQEPVLSMGSES
jgi:phage gp29-like protein